MIFTQYKDSFRWAMIMVSFVIVALILWNTYEFFQQFKDEERIKMETWALAQINFIKSNTTDEIEVTSRILESNTTTPMLLVDSEGKITSFSNIKAEKIKDSIAVTKTIEKFKSEYDPIPVLIDGEIVNTIYYGNSSLINKIKYYPLALLLIMVLFGTVIYFFYKSTKNATQNKLWSGMAKETAHQIGTPLSSLIGWTEILKSEQINPDYIIEIEKDIKRLKTITERFSKIGSITTPKPLDIVKETIDSYDYLKARASKLIEFQISTPEGRIMVNLNKQLYSWTIENLVKNAIDAMKGRGKLTVAISQAKDTIKVSVSDTGMGIHKKQFRKLFEPGYTTKKRGWGLGLSLTKRITEDFHNGKIKVLQSEIGKGTTIQMTLTKA